VRFNPNDRGIYQIIGQSRKLQPADCPLLLDYFFDEFRRALPRHPYDFEASTFVIGALSPGESTIVGECFAGEYVLRISVFNSLRWRRHQNENEGRTP
jgi:hypothetical protein